MRMDGKPLATHCTCEGEGPTPYPLIKFSDRAHTRFRNILYILFLYIWEVRKVRYHLYL